MPIDPVGEHGSRDVPTRPDSRPSGVLERPHLGGPTSDRVDHQRATSSRSQGHVAARPVLNEAQIQVTSDTVAGSVGRWHQDLAADEVPLIGNTLGDIIRPFGYLL